MSTRDEERDHGGDGAPWVLFGTLFASVVTHGAIAVALTVLPTPEAALAASRDDSLVTLEEVIEPVEMPTESEPEPEPETPEPEPEPETPEPAPEPEPEPPRERPQVERTRPPEPQPEPEPETPEPEPAALAEQSLDFSGQIMTTMGPSGFAVQQANGRDTDGPVGNNVARTTGRNVAGRSDGAVGGMGMGAASTADLSRRARAPGNIRALLARNYPRGARQRSVEGRARVRIRIEADGAVTVLGPIGAASPAGEGFDNACQATLRRSRFTPALNPRGQAITSTEAFTCRFTVNR